MPTETTEIESWLPTWLPAQRWFSDKTRTILSSRVTLRHDLEGAVAICIVRVRFETDDAADYVVPVQVAPLSDGTSTPEFLRWLGATFSGSLDWPDVVARQRLTDEVYIGHLPGVPLGVEQSNTSVRYGDDWVVKLNRRLSYGPSPELELSPLLNRWPGESCAPRTAAALSIRTDAGEASFAILAEFVPNVGDGWKVAIDAVGDDAVRRIVPGTEMRSLNDVRSIARLTADMHGALAGDPWTSPLAPERITIGHADAWAHTCGRSLDVALAQLDSVRPTLTGRSAKLAELVSRATPTTREHVAGFRALVGSQRTRIHGDYHLGQVLRRADGGYVAIDFDGEPQRNLAERRAKYSPLRDVAGMMRSLAYAAGTVQADTKLDVDDAWFPAWERSARAAFLGAYLLRLSDNGTHVLPDDPERIRLALRALELEKAVYEVGYELNNRPGWVWIPLMQLVRMS